MVRQDGIKVKLGETDAALTNFPGVVPLANVAKRLGLFADLDELLPPKDRDRGLSNSAAAFDVMCIAWSGGGHVDDLNQLRQDKGLRHLLGREVLPPSTAHDFLRRMRYDGPPALTQANRRISTDGRGHPC